MSVELTFTEIPYHPAGHSVSSGRDTYIHRDPIPSCRTFSVLREGYLHSQRCPYHPAGHSQCHPGGILTFTEIAVPSCRIFTVSSGRDTYIHRDRRTILQDIHSVHREGYCDDTFLHADIHRLFHSTQSQLQSLIGLKMNVSVNAAKMLR